MTEGLQVAYLTRQGVKRIVLQVQHSSISLASLPIVAGTLRKPLLQRRSSSKISQLCDGFRELVQVVVRRSEI